MARAQPEDADGVVRLKRKVSTHACGFEIKLLFS